MQTDLHPFNKEPELRDISVKPYLNDACFIGETLVHLEGGRLEEMQYVGVGKKILARCEATGEIAYKRIFEKHRHEGVFIYYLFYFIDGKDADLPIKATGEHRFWVEGKGWTALLDLQPGDIINSFDGAVVTVNKIREAGYDSDVFNFAIEDFYTYFVEPAGLWVHNTKKTPARMEKKEWRLKSVLSPTS